ncbi:DEKNAAC102376 [Brettanomyces naardenensis]|uniref:DEKNAAC102376 n=1 Tax=Brettanomyces naardenensis TaxID=13370 RepID=A0A448YKJ0_BRENA|nr:DEKNAAC102376 [Brettanomyces naardenensis]
MMQTIDEQLPNKNQEDLIAEKILKRAEIAKLTRQLKSKLFKAGLKVRESQGKLPLSSSSPPCSVNLSCSPAKSNTIVGSDGLKSTVSELPITPMKRRSNGVDGKSRRLSGGSFGDDDEYSSSPIKRLHSGGNLPSSPFYVTSSPAHRMKAASTGSMQTPQSMSSSQILPPKTPPPDKPATLDAVGLTKTPSPNKIQQTTTSSHSAHRMQHQDSQANSQNGLLATPKASSGNKSKEFSTPTTRYSNDNEEGADLLLYMSNSPARTSTSKDAKDTKDYSSFINIPSTPKTSNSSMQFSSTPTFGLDSTPPRGSLLPLPFSTPSGLIGSQLHGNTPNSSTLQSLMGTPNGSIAKFHTPATPTNKLTVGISNKTPGFSMSDYVNIFTPSPRYSRTPEMGHGIPKSSYTKDSNSSGISKSLAEDSTS